MSSPAIAAYRQALRATRIAFRQDTRMVSAARTQIKDGFLKNRLLGEPEATEEVKKLNDVSRFLVENIVQGERQELENGKDRYLLHFHEKTELGDNESIKQSKANMGLLAGAKAVKRCSDK